MAEKYGIISEVRSLENLGLAAAEFSKRNVRKVISLGVPEYSSITLENVCTFLEGINGKGKGVDFYFFGLNSASQTALLHIGKRGFDNLHLANNLDNKLKNGNHEILFFSEDDFERLRKEGVSTVLPELEYPGKTIVMSHDAVSYEKDNRGRFLRRELANRGITKFVSASIGNIMGMNDGSELRLDSLIWDVGNLGTGNCGVLGVYGDGKVGYENIKFRISGRQR